MNHCMIGLGCGFTRALAIQALEKQSAEIHVGQRSRPVDQHNVHGPAAKPELWDFEVEDGVTGRRCGANWGDNGSLSLPWNVVDWQSSLSCNPTLKNAKVGTPVKLCNNARAVDVGSDDVEAINRRM
jgi:hypothetical protein